MDLSDSNSDTESGFLETREERQLRWIKIHLYPGKLLYLEDQVRDDNLPSGYARTNYQCRLVSLSLGQPIWLRLKLIDPGRYPKRPGMVVDNIQPTRGGKHLHCSFRDFEAMIKHIFITDYVKHLDPPPEDFSPGKNPQEEAVYRISDKRAELTFRNAWANLYFREGNCSTSRCSSTSIDHLSRYIHPT